jgi:hypothetical protein
MRADMEKYPLINSTLVTVTLSETSGLKERREYNWTRGLWRMAAADEIA